MQEFETYVKSNWVNPNATTCGITYTHTTRSTIDKKSKTPLVNHTINMKIVYLDKNNNTLQSERLAFTNDTLNKSYEKCLTTINPSELTNKFRAAKQEIVIKLLKAQSLKMNAIQDEINSLQTYYGRNTDIITPSMKGYIEIERSAEPVVINEPKHTFDM